MAVTRVSGCREKLGTSGKIGKNWGHCYVDLSSLFWKPPLFCECGPSFQNRYGYARQRRSGEVSCARMGPYEARRSTGNFPAGHKRRGWNLQRSKVGYVNPFALPSWNNLDPACYSWSKATRDLFASRLGAVLYGRSPFEGCRMSPHGHLIGWVFVPSG
jgi:hypothetical protein